jgi:hypothetical protein
MEFLWILFETITVYTIEVFAVKLSLQISYQEQTK